MESNSCAIAVFLSGDLGKNKRYSKSVHMTYFVQTLDNIFDKSTGFLPH